MQLYHVGKLWTAEEGNNMTTGNTPEDAIQKMFELMPGSKDTTIIYDMVKSSPVAKKVVDLFVCPICQLGVRYVRGKKPNGRMGVMVLHDGETLPEGAKVVEPGEITTEYMKWLLEKCHDVPSTEKENIRGEKAEVTTITEKVEKPKKEMVVLEPLVTIGSTILDEVPTNVPDAMAAAPVVDDNSAKPIVDITGMKHNRFQMVGAVLKALKESGWTDDKIKVVRSDLTENGKDTVAIIHVANQYTIVHENGLPVVMDSGLVVPA